LFELGLEYQVLRKFTFQIVFETIPFWRLGLGIKERGNTLPLLCFCSIFNRFDEMFNPPPKKTYVI
jgi:hypothetical protein